MSRNGNGAAVPNVPELDGFSRRQKLFIEWLATSKYKRIPPTQEALAEALGLNRKTLTRWKRIPGLVDAATVVARYMVHDRLPEVYAALLREAEGGSFQHIKLTLELTGEHTEKQAVDLTTKGESLNVGYTDDQRTRAMVSILAAFREDLLRASGNGHGVMDTAERATSGGDILRSG